MHTPEAEKARSSQRNSERLIHHGLSPCLDRFFFIVLVSINQTQWSAVPACLSLISLRERREIEERDRDIDRDRQRQRDRETETDRDRQTGRQTDLTRETLKGFENLYLMFVSVCLHVLFYICVWISFVDLT